MADWRQIQARVRRAKASADVMGTLSELFKKTHDGMVAYEIAVLHEKAGELNEAVHWFTTAAVRFRRAQWKKKAEEALIRLGAPVPPSFAAERPEDVASVAPASGLDVQAVETAEAEAQPEGKPATEPLATEPRRKSRRGRRGGRRHRRGRGQPEKAAETARAPSPAPIAAESSPEPPGEPIETKEAPAPAAAIWQGRARAGEPALASRMAQLESQLRRLIASQLHALDEADQAPAGPGVFLLSDADQTTYYHAEPCRTLRIAVGNLARGERGNRGEGSVRGRLAEHLGISESKVSKYLKDHCAIRWIQVDEGASHLAHFTVAVLRPALDD